MSKDKKICPIISTGKLKECIKEECLAYSHHELLGGDIVPHWTCAVMNKDFLERSDS